MRTTKAGLFLSVVEGEVATYTTFFFTSFIILYSYSAVKYGRQSKYIILTQYVMKLANVRGGNGDHKLTSRLCIRLDLNLIYLVV